MEALVFLSDALAIVILVITSLQNDKRLPGQKMTGIFRYRESLERQPVTGRRAAYSTKSDA